MIVVDWWGVSGRFVNVMFISDLDRDGFFDLLVQCVMVLDVVVCQGVGVGVGVGLVWLVFCLVCLVCVGCIGFVLIF